jgi:hypothetical protein
MRSSPVRLSLDPQNRHSLEVANVRGFLSLVAYLANHDFTRALRQSGASVRRVGRTSWSGVATRAACVRSTVRSVGSLNRWSLSGGTSITLANGILSPQHLLVEPDQAILQASLSQGGSTFPRSNDAAMPMHDLGGLTIVDDQGVRYLASVKSSSGSWRRSGEPIGSTHLTILITPAPKAGITWLELRGPNGSMSRLTRPTQCAIQVGPITPVEAHPAANTTNASPAPANHFTESTSRSPGSLYIMIRHRLNRFDTPSRLAPYAGLVAYLWF